MKVDLWGTMPEIEYEREFFLDLVKKLSQRPEHYLILSNLDIGRQFDFVVFKEDCILIIELKFTGNNPIKIFESGMWAQIINGEEQKPVKDQNLNSQMKALYFELKDWLERNKALFLLPSKSSNVEFSGIKKVVVFYPTLDRENSSIGELKQISGTKGKVLDANGLVQYLSTARSYNRKTNTNIVLTRDELKKIPQKLLGLPQFQLDENGIPTVIQGEASPGAALTQERSAVKKELQAGKKVSNWVIFSLIGALLVLIVFFMILSGSLTPPPPASVCPPERVIASENAISCINQQKTVNFKVLKSGRMYECGHDLCLSDPNKTFSIEVKNLTDSYDKRVGYFISQFSEKIVCVTGLIILQSGKPQIELLDGSPPNGLQICQ